MSKKKNKIFITLLTLLLCITVLSVIQSKNQSIQDFFTLLIAVLGVIVVVFELKESKDVAVGEFITNLNNSFQDNDDIKSIYKKLIKNERITEEDQCAVVEYLTFFETIYLLLDRNVLNMKFIDDLFSYRFFAAINNKDIQDMEIIKDADSYMNIYTLDYLWRNYRKKIGKTVDEEHSLEKNTENYEMYVNKKYYRKSKVTYLWKLNSLAQAKKKFQQ